MFVAHYNTGPVLDRLHHFNEAVEIGCVFIVDGLYQPTGLGAVKSEGAGGFANVDTVAFGGNSVQASLLI